MPIRTFIINRRQAGQPLVVVMQAQLHISQAEALRCVREHGVRLAGNLCTDVDRRVRSGQRLHIKYDPKPAAKKKSRPEQHAESVKLPPAPQGIVVRHIDKHVVVVEKPAGLTTVRHAEEAAEFGRRARRYLPATLADLLPAVLRARGARLTGRIRAVHRLDKETSGLVLFALTFRAHALDRRYLALVRGHARDERIESYLVRDRGDGRRGSGSSGAGQHAVTHVRVVDDLGESTLVECRLETGRTHQVRIHLAEQGTPLCGERIYDRPVHGRPLADTSRAERPMLHAATLAFDHPATGQRMEWEAPLPQDMYRMLQRLRSQRPKSRS